MPDEYPIRVTPVTRTLSPGLFRRLVLPAHHRTWAATERVMLADPNERRRIEELEIELAGKGFERPVVIQREQWWNVRPRVCDGVHRSVAALRLGLPVLVRIGDDRTVLSDRSDVYRVTLPAASPFPANLAETVLTASSFRCSAGPWIQYDCAAYGEGGQVDVHLDHHPDVRHLIAAELQERVRGAGVEGAVVEFLERRINA
jgi:hypothetical protein